jgi:hypothetical protein
MTPTVSPYPTPTPTPTPTPVITYDNQLYWGNPRLEGILNIFGAPGQLLEYNTGALPDDVSWTQALFVVSWNTCTLSIHRSSYAGQPFRFYNSSDGKWYSGTFLSGTGNIILTEI